MVTGSRWWYLALACLGLLCLASAPAAAQDVIDDPTDDVPDCEPELSLDPCDDGGNDTVPEFGAETKRGVATPVGPDTSVAVLQNASAADLSRLDGIEELPDNVVRFDTGSERGYVVTDAEPGVAAIEVTGYESPGLGPSILIATDVSTRHSPTRVDAEEAFATPEQYRGELVRVELSNYTQVPLMARDGDAAVHTQYAIGTNAGANASLPTDPAGFGFDAVRSTVDADTSPAAARNRSTYVDSGAALLGAESEPGVAVDVRERTYAGRAPATVDLAVTEREPGLWVESVEYDAREVDGLAALENASTGDVVRVDGTQLGVQVSTRASLTAVANCGSDDLVPVPPAGCVPAVTDVVGHGGVLLDGNDTFVPYVGASNAIQVAPTGSVYANATVTARVVDASRLPADVGAERALIVLDADFRDGDRASPGAAAGNTVDRLLERLQASVYRELHGLDAAELPPNGSRPAVDAVGDVPARLNATANASAATTVDATVSNYGWNWYNDTLRVANASANGSEPYGSARVRIEPGSAASVSVPVEIGVVGNVSLALRADGLEARSLGVVTVANVTGSNSSPSNGSDGSGADEDESSSGDGRDPGGGFVIPSSDDGDDEQSDGASDADQGEDEAESESEADDTEPSDEEDRSAGDDASTASDPVDDESDATDDGSSANDTASGTEEPAAGDETPGFGPVLALLALVTAASRLRRCE